MPSIDTSNTRAGFSSVVATINSKERTIKAINYGDGVARSKIEGNSRMSLGYSDGMYSADDATVELYLSEYDDIMDDLGEEFYTRSFPITVAYVSGGKTRTDILIGCMFKKNDRQNASGSGDALTRTFNLDVLYVKPNGKNPLPSDQMPTGAK